MKIGITGASGLIGTALATALRAKEHEVVSFVRRPGSAVGERRWDGEHLAPDAVADLDAVVHLAGAGVGDKRWSSSYKQQILDSRVKGTTAVARAVAQAGTPVLLSASAIGFYGDTGDELMDETGRRGPASSPRCASSGRPPPHPPRPPLASPTCAPGSS